MAFEKGTYTVRMEVTAPPGCFLTMAPDYLRVAKGDPGVFQITLSRQGGYTGPVFLRAVNLSYVDPQPEDPSENTHHFAPNPVPAGVNTATLTLDTEGFEAASVTEITVEPCDVLPEGEYPVV